MPEAVVTGRPGGELSGVDQLGYDRMILSKLPHLALMQEICPAVAHMCNMHCVPLAEGQHDRRSHVVEVWIGDSSGTDFLVGTAEPALHELTDLRCVCCSGKQGFDHCRDHLDGHGAGHRFARLNSGSADYHAMTRHP